MAYIRKLRAVTAVSSSLLKAHISSIIATSVDWSLTFSLTHWLGSWYVISTIAGAVTGGVTNFMLNRNWTFNSPDCKKNPFSRNQFIRYVLVWSFSIALNTFGTVFLTEIVLLNYMIAKMTTAVTVAVCFNYFMQKNFVFRFTV